jgi:ubiquinol-cytochrome c reductase cytochrome c subunit
MSTQPSQDPDLESVGFDTGVAQTGAENAPRAPRLTTARRRSRRSRIGRRLVGGLVLLIALVSMGGVYSLFAQPSSAVGGDAAAAAKGRQLYSISCITCHGANLEGVTDRGPSLRGVGGAATYFYVATGRMPLAEQGGEAVRHAQMYTSAEIDELVAYVQQQGGGTPVPQGSLRDDAHIAEGGELFRLNCASCHNFAGQGAALSAGKNAPNLNAATDKQVVTAMLTGPGNMPVFGDNELTPEQKHQIVSYLQTIKKTADPGGSGLGRVGPVTEGLVIWVVGIGVMMATILWIGAKS